MIIRIIVIQMLEQEIWIEIGLEIEIERRGRGRGRGRGRVRGKNDEWRLFNVVRRQEGSLKDVGSVAREVVVVAEADKVGRLMFVGPAKRSSMQI